jgi:acyl-CoA reductase-like NAD-dependent aldehyde dehydrogenase
MSDNFAALTTASPVPPQMPDAGAPRWLRARNPRTGLWDAAFPVPDQDHIAGKIAAMRAVQPAWAAAPIAVRADLLRQFAEMLRRVRPDLQVALEADTGRRLISISEIDAVIAAIEGWSALSPRLLTDDWSAGRSNPSLRHRPQWVAYPLTVVISPWNFPLLLALIDAIPALLAGCVVVVKSSEVTPRFAAALQPVIERVEGLTALLWLLPGDAAVGAALIDHADIVCFTGSVATGRVVARQAAERMIPAFLELGGKDPLLVLEGADLDAASDAALRGAVLATGQACQSIERLLVARPLHDDFVALLAEKAKAVRFNWPDIAVGELGPIIFAPQAAVLAAQIEDALARGAQLHCGGRIEHHGGGLWLAPTLLTGVTPAMAVMREESFGPLLPVMAFDHVDDAVTLANDSDFGLSAAVFAGSLDEAEAVGRRLEAGAVSLNDAALTALFHEAPKQSFKLSGLGPSRMGLPGFTRFLRCKALIANHARPLPLSRFSEG